MTRTAVYLRISEDRKGEELGVTRQREDCLALCSARNFTDPVVFQDNDISATKGRARPAYEDLTRHISSGDFKRVVVYHTSRIWRNPRQRLDGRELFRKMGVALIPVKGPELDFTSAHGRMIADFIGAVDTAEVEISGERKSRAMIQKAQNGEYLGGKKAYGISEDGKSLIDEEANRIRCWYKSLLAGGSIASMAKESGKHHSSVANILKAPRNAGLRILHGERYSTPHPAIVSEDVWMAAVAILRNPQRSQHTQGNASKWFGSGLYFCGRCKTQSVKSHYMGNKKRAYICRNCSSWWGADRVDQYVMSVMAKWLEKHLKNLPGATPKTSASSELRAVRLRMEALGREFALDDDADPTAFRAAVKVLRERQAELEEQVISESQGNAISSIRSVDTFLNLKDVPRKKAIISSVMKVELSPSPTGKGSASHFGPKISWKI